jgi:hypothetical protein
MIAINFSKFQTELQNVFISRFLSKWTTEQVGLNRTNRQNLKIKRTNFLKGAGAGPGEGGWSSGREWGRERGGSEGVGQTFFLSPFETVSTTDGGAFYQILTFPTFFCCIYYIKEAGADADVDADAVKNGRY